MKKASALLLALVLLLPLYAHAETYTISQGGFQRHKYTVGVDIPAGEYLIKPIEMYDWNFTLFNKNGSSAHPFNDEHVYTSDIPSITVRLLAGQVFSPSFFLDNYGLTLTLLQEYECQDPDTELVDETVRKAIQAALAKYDYNTIQALIEEHVPATNERHLPLTALISEGQAIMAKCSVTYDAIEKDTLVTFGTLDGISDTIHMCTYIDNDIPKTTFGFIEDDWIFFDRIYFAGDNIETIYFSCEKTITDVLKGGHVLEAKTLDMGYYERIIMSTAVNPVVRFKNERKNKHYDYAVSQDEMDAFRMLRRLRDINREINSLIF